MLSKSRRSWFYAKVQGNTLRGIATLFVPSAVSAAPRYSNAAHTQEPDRSVDLGIELAVNEDSDGGAAEVSLWVTNHGSRVAYD